MLAFNTNTPPTTKTKAITKPRYTSIHYDHTVYHLIKAVMMDVVLVTSVKNLAQSYNHGIPKYSHGQ